MLASQHLRTATAVGTALQLAMVIAGHFVPAVAACFGLGGVAISALAGLLYGRQASGTAGAALGGAIAGGGCALIGIAVSVVLHDVDAMVLVFGTLASAVTGLLGGLAGRLVPAVRAIA